jgi:uncharacterized protein
MAAITRLMSMQMLLELALAGLLAGVLAGLLGIGGGTLMGPLLLHVGLPPVQAFATSNLAIVITSLSGTWQNWRMGVMQWQPVLFLGLPAIATAAVSAIWAKAIPDHWLLVGLGLVFLLNLYLMELRERLNQRQTPQTADPNLTRQWQVTHRLLTGSLAGLLAGFFGVGGGSLLVPLQLLLLGEAIKAAIQTSLGVIVLTSSAATLVHASQGNVQWQAGLILGFGGLLGAQLGTRILPKLPDRLVKQLFQALLILLAAYAFWRALSQP